MRFAILCAIEVCKNEEWRRWAENWLSGKDKTASSSKHAAYAPIAYEAAYATEAAYTAAHAAHAAYVVTHAAHAEYAAAYVAAHAAHAAAYAAACAARAAGAAPAPDATHAASEAARAAAKKDSFSLVELAEKSYAMIPKRKSLLGE